MEEKKNVIKYYYITECGKKLDLEMAGLFLEEKKILEVLKDKNVPCSILRIKLLIYELEINKSWEFVESKLKNLESNGYVEMKR